MKKLGFIGAGNMTEAIIGGVINAKTVKPASIIASDIDEKRLGFIAKKYKIKTSLSNTEVAKQSDILFLCIKPGVHDAVIDEIKYNVKENAVVIILTAGYSLDAVKMKFGMSHIKFIKTMPNTPSLVNCGMTAICADENVTEAELDFALKIFNSIGKTEVLAENYFDAFTAIAGSSPAYAFIFIEAMAEAAVKHGLSRKEAIKISAQALFGAAKMVLETGIHPAVLKDMVCTPGGTTIEAVCELEKQGFRNAVISAVTACTNKYNEMN